MSRNITFAGNPVTVLGNEVKVGTTAPNFTAVNKDLSPFNLSDLDGKVKIVSVVPSVDTPVCELQTIQFNEEAAKLDDVVVLTVSVDLPFAQQRFCAAKSIESSVVVSDHKDLDFGLKYGFAIEEFRLLTRGILVLDKDNVVKHVEYVSEITEHPNYDEAIKVAKNI